MENEKVISVLEDLVETCRDGQNGYRDAAEHVKNPELRAYFNQQSTERARFAGELESEIQRLGKPDPERKGSTGGTLHRTWMDLKSSLGGGDHSILNSVEAGEDTAKEAYEEALEETLPEPLVLIIRRQAEKIFAAHDQVKSLRNRFKAA